ncbi:glutathione S-transferase family protein [Glaciimonas soli]|uniref:Glutathione S-transferase n=1 Tax=Glaciimonas soli TaxID=2590999 RepID=A0A843YT92_9BURK|nr:glutathione S-transferase [Glaciimonas soli]MQQ99885.1 glutathione S-transferase [Glaciimonas soli]
MLKILGKSTSINVRKVFWTCAEIGIPFEHEDWGTGFRSTQVAEFLALNPSALIPVIKDDDFVLWESNAICRYLCVKHQRTDLLPDAPKGRAEVEKWMDWQATELNNAWRYAFMALVRNSAAHNDPHQLANSIESWNKHIGILDQQLQASGMFVTGSNFTVADVVLGLSVHRWFAAPIQRPAYAAVSAYYQLLSERAGFMQYGRNGIP